MERQVTIVNRLGLHARAAAKLVTLASRYHSEIQLRTEHRTVSGKSIMGVLMLAAAQGTELTIGAEGDDAPEALDAIAALVADRFGEGA
ncbi:MAG TPA: HPr family phosphocarrier protein [Nevskiaceae bacterium]|nr:HPr family phosphocarrier protein [Nevskiaceae bacterium]